MSPEADTRFHTPPTNERRHLAKLRQIAGLFREVDPGITSSYIEAFLVVAAKPGHGPTEYAKDLGTSQPAMSRVLLEIGIKARLRGAGYGLVDREPDPRSLRQQRYFLTHRGKVLYHRLMDVMTERVKGNQDRT